MDQFHFVRKSFYGLQDEKRFIDGLNEIIASLNTTNGFFAGDNLIAIERNMAFLADRPFMMSMVKNANTRAEQAAIWRYATLIWAARQALRRDGDFVECGCYKGTAARIITDAVDFGSRTDRHYYLYDLFDHDESMAHHAMPEHSATLFDQVTQRFADLPNVTVTQGRVPEVLAAVAPEKIAFLYVDMNNMEAEIGALEALFDRVTTGGVIILDDYGWLAYREQMKAETAWFEARGCSILDLPTGQGMIVK